MFAYAYIVYCAYIFKSTFFKLDRILHKFLSWIVDKIHQWILQQRNKIFVKRFNVLNVSKWLRCRSFVANFTKFLTDKTGVGNRKVQRMATVSIFNSSAPMSIFVNYKRSFFFKPIKQVCFCHSLWIVKHIYLYTNCAK